MKSAVRSLPVFICVCLLFLLPVTRAFADTAQQVRLLQASAIQKKLWQRIQWLNLLHYEKTLTSGYASQADDAEFFNAPDGNTNPRAELLATIAAFYNTDVSGDEQAQCRFVARLHWLKQVIGMPMAGLPKEDCKAYREWRAQISDYQVTMVFPAYYLNSPSSMFGHNLLRLDPKDGDNNSALLSTAVNFGANIDPDDNSISFAFKGLTGGYPGYFIVTPYFKKIREYNRQENRDMWEYPLNLTPEETQRLVLHLWELKDIDFDYYFFNENCSYRLLELLEVARPGVQLTNDYSVTAIPVDIVRSIQQAGMIRSVHFRPSQASILHKRIDRIPEELHHWILDIADKPAAADNPQFQALPMEQQRDIVDAAYRYLRFKVDDESRTKETARTSYQLLKRLNSYPAAEPVTFHYHARPPETGHLSKRVSLGRGEFNQRQYTDLGFRMSFHSLEDNATGFLKGAQINIGSGSVRAYDNNRGIRLQQLDLVDIFSLTPRDAFFTPLSWRVYGGLERQLTFGRERLVSHVTAGAGVTYEPLDDNYTYAMLRLRLEHNDSFDPLIEPGIGVMLGSLQHFHNSTARLSVNTDRFSNGEYRYDAQYVHNFVLSRNHALMFMAKREIQPELRFSEFRLSYHYYF